VQIGSGVLKVWAPLYWPTLYVVVVIFRKGNCGFCKFTFQIILVYLTDCRYMILSSFYWGTVVVVTDSWFRSISWSLDLHVSRGRVFTSVCLCVCLFFHTDIISITDAARITEVHVEMFQGEFEKPIYFEVKRSKVKIVSLIVSAGLF